MLPDELFLAEHGRPAIDYNLIAQAVNYYKDIGFKYIEVPWVVPEEYNKITFPGPFPFKTEYGVLVGSAEQSFLYLASLGKLKYDVPYVAVSPCFREERVDETHHKSFIKVELFTLGWASTLLRTAAKELYMALGLMPHLVETEQGFDWYAKGIELGSYGDRQHKELKWSYGTGLAEPRTSYVLSI